VDALILDRLGCVCDFDQLARGLFGIAERRWLGVSPGLMLGCDVWDMDQGILEAMAVEHLARGYCRWFQSARVV
jgi:hypothetical protein